MSRENKNILRKGQETEEKEKKQVRTVNRISLVGVMAAAVIFVVASIAGIATVGFHMACFSAFMVVFAEAHEWVIVLYAKKAEKAAFNADKQKYKKKANFLKDYKYVFFAVVFAMLIISVSIVSAIGKYFGNYTDIICAVTILCNILSLYFRLR